MAAHNRCRHSCLPAADCAGGTAAGAYGSSQVVKDLLGGLFHYVAGEARWAGTCRAAAWPPRVPDREGWSSSKLAAPDGRCRASSSNSRPSPCAPILCSGATPGGGAAAHPGTPAPAAGAAAAPCHGDPEPRASSLRPAAPPAAAERGGGGGAGGGGHQRRPRRGRLWVQRGPPLQHPGCAQVVPPHGLGAPAQLA